jgi:uncharacterized membrane protein
VAHQDQNHVETFFRKSWWGTKATSSASWAAATAIPAWKDIGRSMGRPNARNSVLRRIWHASIIGNLVAGSLVILPFVLTVLIIRWVINWMVSAFGPGTLFGDLIIIYGQAFVGPKREYIAFLIGAIAVLIAIWLLGLAVRTRAQRTFAHVLDDLFAKVPLFRSIYRPVSQVVRVFAGSNADLSRLPVVMCRLGGEQGVDVPAFLASTQTYEVRGEMRRLIFLPTSPLPAWGGLVLVPESSVIPVPDMDADALIKLYFSFGVLASEIIPSVAQGEPPLAQQPEAAMPQERN